MKFWDFQESVNAKRNSYIKGLSYLKALTIFSILFLFVGAIMISGSATKTVYNANELSYDEIFDSEGSVEVLYIDKLLVMDTYANFGWRLDKDAYNTYLVYFLDKNGESIFTTLESVAAKGSVNDQVNDYIYDSSSEVGDLVIHGCFKLHKSSVDAFEDVFGNLNIPAKSFSGSLEYLAETREEYEADFGFTLIIVVPFLLLFPALICWTIIQKRKQENFEKKLGAYEGIELTLDNYPFDSKLMLSNIIEKKIRQEKRHRICAIILWVICFLIFSLIMIVNNGDSNSFVIGEAILDIGNYYGIYYILFQLIPAIKYRSIKKNFEPGEYEDISIEYTSMPGIAAYCGKVALYSHKSKRLIRYADISRIYLKKENAPRGSTVKYLVKMVIVSKDNTKITLGYNIILSAWLVHECIKPYNPEISIENIDSI